MSEPIPFDIPPGVVKRQSALTINGRYADADKVRFIQGKPEKIGGWERWSTEPLLGSPRTLHSWNDTLSLTRIACGTSRRLYGFSLANEPINITPWAVPGGETLSNAFSTVAGTPLVTIQKALHGLKVGQCIAFAAPLAVGGVTLSGEYFIDSLVSDNAFRIIAASNATSTVSNVGTATIFTEYAPGPEHPAGGYGWGVGGYGVGTYGTARPITNIIFEPRIWSLDNYGKLLLAAPYLGPLFVWDPTISPTPRASLQSASGPGGMRAMFVTPERFVFALGASPDTGKTVDPLLVRWPDQSDYTAWTPTTTNRARARRLQIGRKCVAGAAVGNSVSLVWTDAACFQFQYTGSALVYDSRVIGTNCGLAGPNAFVVVQSAAFWLSTSGLFMYNGGVVPIPNSEDVRQWLIGQIRTYYEVKTTVFFNPLYNEVWFLVVPANAQEPAIYAMVKIGEWHWTNGTLQRVSATQINAIDLRPIMGAPDGYIYAHETGVDADDSPMPWRLQTGLVPVGSRREGYDITEIVPDWERITGTVTVNITMFDNPRGPMTDEQTVTITPETASEDLRVAGRFAQIVFASEALRSDFRFGQHTFSVIPSTSRR